MDSEAIDDPPDSITQVQAIEINQDSQPFSR